MRDKNPLMGAAAGLYQLLLVLYPASFRQEFGREMVLLFRDASYFEQERRGTGPMLGLWIGMFLDLFATAFLERLKEVSAMSGSGLLRIAGLGGILAGVIWIILVILDPLESGSLMSLLTLVPPVLVIVLSLAMYLQGGHSAASLIGLAALAISSVLLALSMVFYLVQFDAEDGAAFGLLFFGVGIQGLALIIIGYRLRSLGDFSGWNMALMVIGLVMIIYLPIFGLLDGSVWVTRNGDLLFRIWLWLLAAGWILLGAMAYIGFGQKTDQPAQSAS